MSLYNVYIETDVVNNKYLISIKLFIGDTKAEPGNLSPVYYISISQAKMREHIAFINPRPDFAKQAQNNLC